MAIVLGVLVWICACDDAAAVAVVRGAILGLAILVRLLHRDFDSLHKETARQDLCSADACPPEFLCLT